MVKLQNENLIPNAHTLEYVFERFFVAWLIDKKARNILFKKNIFTIPSNLLLYGSDLLPSVNIAVICRYIVHTFLYLQA